MRRFLFAMLLALGLATGQSALLMVTTNGAITGPTGFLATAILQGTNVALEWTNGGKQVYIHSTATGAGGGTGITVFNGLTADPQALAIGSSGTAPAWSSVTATHTLNLPYASNNVHGILASNDWATFMAKAAVASVDFLTNEVNSLKGMTNQFAKAGMTNDFAKAAMTNEFAKAGMTNQFALASWTNYARTNFVGASNPATPLKIVGSGSVTVSSNSGEYTIGYSGAGITLSDVTNGTPFGFDASVGTAGDVNAAGAVTSGGTNLHTLAAADLTLRTNWGISGTASNYVFDFSAGGTNKHPTYYVPCQTNALMVFYATNAPANTRGKVEVVLDNTMSTTNRTLYFPAGWNGLGWMWSTTITLTNGKRAKLTIESFGLSNAQTNILAGYAPVY